MSITFAESGLRSSTSKPKHVTVSEKIEQIKESNTFTNKNASRNALQWMSFGCVCAIAALKRNRALGEVSLKTILTEELQENGFPDNLDNLLQQIVECSIDMLVSQDCIECQHNMGIYTVTDKFLMVEFEENDFLQMFNRITGTPSEDTSNTNKVATEIFVPYKTICEVNPNLSPCPFFVGIGLDKLPPRGKFFIGDGWTCHDYRMVSSVSASVSPVQAREILQKHRYIYNRTVRDEWSQELSKNLCDLVVDLVFYKNTITIMNGHHSLLACLNQGRVQSVTFICWEAKTEKAIAYLFSRFDSNKKRTRNQCINVHQMTTSNPIDIPRNWLCSLTSAVSNARRGTKIGAGCETLDNGTRLLEDEDFLSFANFFMAAVKNSEIKKTNPLVPAAVILGFYECYLSDKEKANKFLRGYLSGANLDEGDPRLALRKKIGDRSTKIHVAHMGKYFLSYIYYAWTAFKKGRKDIKMQNLRDNHVVPKHGKW